MPARWWGTHKDNFDGCCEYKILMRVRLIEKYDGRSDSHDHLEKCTDAYGVESQPKWVHLFCHTLDIILMNWYLETKLRHGTEEWDILRQGFIMTFNFEDGFDYIDTALQEVKAAVFRIP